MFEHKPCLPRLCKKPILALVARLMLTLLPQQAFAQTPATQDDLARLAKECADSIQGPFKSVSDIRREIDCVAAAVKARENSPRVVESPVIWITARTAGWEYRYGLDGALQDIPACVITSGIMLPQGRPVTINLTSTDTIHEWTIPALGIKATAIPGRIEAATLRNDTALMVDGVMVRDAGSPKARSAAFTLQFLAEAEYTAWERRTLRAQGCGRGG